MQELAAAEGAKKVINALLVSSADTPTMLETLRKAYDQARRGTTPILSSAGALNAATCIERFNWLATSSIAYFGEDR